MSAEFSSQHTSNFPALLSELGVSLLVSTYQAGMLFMVRALGEDLNTHFTALERPMGIALDGDKLAVATLYRIMSYQNLPAAAPHLEPAGIHDACFVPRSVHVTGQVDAHEMAYGEAGLWLVNTRMSCLCTLDERYSVVPRWRPAFVSGYDVSDRCHLSGLAMRDGEPAFVTALGATDTAEGWRDDRLEGGVIVDVSANEVVVDGLCMPHSPRWHRERLWFLESGRGELGFINSAGDGKTVVAALPGFTRGLDFLGRLAFVGLSRLRESSGDDLPLTERPEKRECGVWVVDTETRQTVAFLAFTGDVEEIFGVCVVPHRCPAVLDFDHPLVQTSYSLPDAALRELQL